MFGGLDKTKPAFVSSPLLPGIGISTKRFYDVITPFVTQDEKLQ